MNAFIRKIIFPLFLFVVLLAQTSGIFAQCVYSVSTEYVTLSPEGGSEYVYVSSGECESYSVSSNDSWFYYWIDYYEHTITIYADPNYDTYRSGTITVHDDWTNSDIYITVDQEVTICEQLPSPGVISGPTSICAEGSANYSISPVEGADYYIWKLNDQVVYNQNSTTAYITFSSPIASPSTITVAGYNECGLGIPASKEITIKFSSGNPTSVNINPNDVCQGTQVNLSVSGGSLGTGSSWKWYTGSCGGTLIGTGPNINVSPTVTTTYYVRAEGDCNSTTCTFGTVTVKSYSTSATSLNISQNNTCPGTVVTLSLSGGSLGTGASWKWYSGTCGGTYIDTGSSIDVSPSATTTYYARAEGDCNSTACVLNTVTVKSVSTSATAINVSQNNTCPGTQVNLSVSGGSLGTGASWKWYTGSCGGTLIGTGLNINVSPTVTTTYYVRAEGDCNSTTCASGTVTVKSYSTSATSLNISQNNTCPGTVVTLSLSEGSLGTGASWKWYSGTCGGTYIDTGSSIDVSPSATTTYYARAEGDCNSTACVLNTVTVKSVSTSATAINVSQNNTCPGTQVNLSVSGGSLGTGASWKWYTGSCGGTLIGTGPNINVSPTVTTTYYVRAEGDCNSTTCAFGTVTVKSYSTSATSLNISQNNTCPGTVVTLSLSGGSLGTGASWKWYSETCGAINEGTGASIIVSPGITTTYYVRAEGDCNVTSCTSTSLTVKSLSVAPSSIISDNDSICSGSSVNLTHNGGSLGTGADWVWYSGSVEGTFLGAGSDIFVNLPTTTSVYLRAEGDCNNTGSVSTLIFVYPSPVISTNPADLTADPDENAIFHVVSSGLNLQYQWQTSLDDSSSWADLSGPPASGYDTPDLTIESPFFENRYYRCRIISDCDTIYSQAAELSLPQVNYLSQENIPDPEVRNLTLGLPGVPMKGSIDVNPTGAATLSIPLDLPLGINGLAPALSINYSSNSGAGILGYGWNLSGISGVGRGPQNIYNDGITRGISFDNNDRFYLDGQRLVNTSGNYGDAGISYQTENDIFTRVTAQNIDVNGPGWFKAETRSGVVFEYGHTPDSKQTPDNYSAALSWYVSKISDLFGNEINFTYIQDQGMLYPAEITYGLNEIIFNYSERIDTVISYLKGSEIGQYLLLNRIVIKYNSQIVKSYEFKFSQTGSDYNPYSLLNEIIEYGIGETRLTSTVCSYSLPDSVSFSWNTVDANHQYINYQSKIYPGDFNGDGKSDVLCIPEPGRGAQWTGLKLFLNAGGFHFNNEYSDTTIDLTDAISLQVIDINGDGFDDLVYKKISESFDFYYMLCDGNSLSEPFLFASLDSEYSPEIPDEMLNYRFSEMNTDYNGDGVNDIFIKSINGDWDIYSFVSSLGEKLDTMSVLATGSLHPIGDYDVFPGDFNGDGKSDLYLFNDSQLKISSLSGSSLSLQSFTTINRNYFFKIGDFNGDGKSDIFTYGRKIEGIEYDGNWELRLSTGSNFKTYIIPKKKNNLKDDNVELGDINGDGATDLMVTDYSRDTTYYYISKKQGTDFLLQGSSPFGSNFVFYSGDFDGNGRSEFVSTSQYGTWNGYRIGKASGRSDILMDELSDGLGALTRISYKSLSEADSPLYQRGTGSDYPVLDYQGHLVVVSSLETANGLEDFNSKRYHYKGARIHLQGKGFLGYNQISVIDSITGIENQILSDFHPDYYYPRVYESLSKLTGTSDTIAKTLNTWDQVILDSQRKRIFIYVSNSSQFDFLSGNSASLETSFDSYGNPVSSIKSYPDGTTESASIQYSNISTQENWLIGRPVRTVTEYQDNDTTITREVSHVFNSSNNNVVHDTIYPGTVKELVRTYSYNQNGTLSSVNETAGEISRSSSITYETDNIRIHTSTDLLSHTTTNTYDNYGRIESVSDYLDNSSTYQYNTSGQLSSVTSGNGKVVNSLYGWSDSTSDPEFACYWLQESSNDGSLKKTWFDNLGRSIRSDLKGFDGEMIMTNTEYNAKGLVNRISEPYLATETPAWNTFEYDDYGRKTGFNPYSGGTSEWDYDLNTVTETIAGKYYTREMDALGRISSATDAGGTLLYSYLPDGKTKSIEAPGSILTTMKYDIAGNQTELNDPSAGIIKYKYDAFGQITLQDSAGARMTSFIYYPDGRISEKSSSDGTTTYTYNDDELLESIASPDSLSRTYEYDEHGRITSVTDEIPGSDPFTTSYTYDGYERLDTITHPSGVTETRNYNSNGWLSSISAAGSTVWTITGTNARGQITSGRYGSNLITSYGYDQYGFPESTVTGAIRDYSYGFDHETGNLNSRQNNKHTGLIENFIYDQLDRLDSIERNGNPVLSMQYGQNAGITLKSDAGAIVYDVPGKPYAPGSIDPSEGLVPEADQVITYTSFGKVKTISENSYASSFIYDPGEERARMTVSLNDSTILTRWYPTGSYIKETAGGVTKEYTFIGGDAYSAPVVCIAEDNTVNWYYLLRDHLGSITHVVSAESDSVVAEYSYDAWGRMRNPATWEAYEPGNEPELFVAGRGYTSHEHLPWFNSINMNGRVYDPLAGMFLSPDIYIQNPSSTQNFNRYAYCLNNPLSYSDPSGMLREPGPNPLDQNGYPHNRWGAAFLEGYYSRWEDNYGNDPRRGGGGDFYDQYTYAVQNGFRGTMSKFDKQIRKKHNGRAGFWVREIHEGGSVSWPDNIISGDCVYSDAYVIDKFVPLDPSGQGGINEITFNDGLAYQSSTFGNELVGAAAKSAWTTSVKSVTIGSTEAAAQKVLSGVVRTTKYIGWIGNAVDLTVNYTNAYTNRNSQDAAYYDAKAVGATIIVGLNAINFIAPGLGTALSLTAAAIDAAGGFNWIYNRYK